METNQQNLIAETILQQLGGGRFRAMTGAKKFMAIEGGGLTFVLPSGAASSNFITVTLNSDDLYDLRFEKRGSDGRLIRFVAGCCDIDAENLRHVFETNAGLRTSL